MPAPHGRSSLAKPVSPVMSRIVAGKRSKFGRRLSSRRLKESVASEVHAIAPCTDATSRTCSTCPAAGNPASTNFASRNPGAEDGAAVDTEEVGVSVT